ncbi:hypothetical protein DY245_20335 [Streptomyces inhibens]|uniref:Uncharacterized protein n=1 Tax=Streptomyces inhibens TaxID=2293571 RepID=A0A371Q1Y8_STRIH|nr:hypothetical protein DY245_20335 [Streptomyces inhibens]
MARRSGNAHSRDPGLLVTSRRRKPRRRRSTRCQNSAGASTSQTSTTTTRYNVRSAENVPGRSGKGPATPSRVGCRSGGEYGCGTERTSHAVIRVGVALGERQGRSASRPAGKEPHHAPWLVLSRCPPYPVPYSVPYPVPRPAVADFFLVPGASERHSGASCTP